MTFAMVDLLMKRRFEPTILWLSTKGLIGLTLIMFTIVGAIWFEEDVGCYSKYDRYADISETVGDICRTYPYTLEGKLRHFVVFYRFIPQAFVVVIFIAFGPIYLRNGLFHRHLRLSLTLFTKKKDCATISKEYLHRFFSNQMSYSSTVLYHFICLFMLFTVFGFMNFTLQGRFYDLFHVAYSGTRAIESFNDTLSRMFPHFIECEVNPQIKLFNIRTEKFGCELYHMNEVMICCMILWLFLVITGLLVVSSFIYYIILGNSSSMKRSLLPKCGYPEKDKKFIVKNAFLDDILMLSYIEPYLTTGQKKELLDDAKNLIEHLFPYPINPNETF